LTFKEGWVESLGFRLTFIFLTTFQQPILIYLVRREESESFAESSESN